MNARPSKPLIIFDCDGVLIDSERLVNRIEAKFLRTLGVTLDDHEARRRFKGKTTAEVAAAIASETGQPVPIEWAYDWGMVTAQGFVEELKEISGVRALIEHLLADGCNICVASQSSLARVRLSLRVTNLACFFGSAVYTASMVAHPKPAPDLFLYAARAHDTDPARCIVIEDSVYGVVAARAAFMRVIGYAADEDPLALAAAGAEVVTSMTEVLNRWGDFCPRSNPVL